MRAIIQILSDSSYTCGIIRTMGRINPWTYCILLAMLLAGTAGATTVPSLTFDQLTDQSDLVVSGQVTRSWSAWDSDHKFIWTHHEVAVEGIGKGSPGATITISEP